MSAIRTMEAPTAATAERPRRLPLGAPLLTLAALGLIACSLVTLKGPTQG